MKKRRPADSPEKHEAFEPWAVRPPREREDPADSPVSAVSPSIERFIQRVRDDGCRLPVSRDDLRETYGYVKDEIIREMARRRLLVLSEAWDGSLPPVAAAMLEQFHVTSRENFRTRYLAGEFALNRWRLIGKVTRLKILAWAGIMGTDDDELDVSLSLSVKTCRELDALVKQRGLHSRSELVTQLVTEARGGGKISDHSD